jgi:hypothetical protein
MLYHRPGWYISMETRELRGIVDYTGVSSEATYPIPASPKRSAWNDVHAAHALATRSNQTYSDGPTHPFTKFGSRMRPTGQHARPHASPPGHPPVESASSAWPLRALPKFCPRHLICLIGRTFVQFLSVTRPKGENQTIWVTVLDRRAKNALTLDRQMSLVFCAQIVLILLQIEIHISQQQQKKTDWKS